MSKIEKYVDDLFKDIRISRKSEELKEELLADLEDKYQDLIKGGMNEDEAYKEVIGGIGEVDELLAELKTPVYRENDAIRKKTAFVVSLSVGLYILSLISVIVLEELLEAPQTISAVSFFGIAGISTCILIYHFMSIPKYDKEDDTWVEEIKEKRYEKDKNKQLLDALDTIVWLLVLIIYFLISFMFNCWYISWVMFLVGPLVTTIVHLIVGVECKK